MNALSLYSGIIMSSKGDTVLFSWLGAIAAINWLILGKKAYPRAEVFHQDKES